jgi:AraC-like DNA-binding protein
MNTETLDFGIVSPDNIEIVYPQDRPLLPEGVHAHCHPFWEVKVFTEPESGSPFISIGAPNAIHYETPRKFLKLGWVLSFQRPDVGLMLYADSTRDRFLPFDKISELCPGGLEELLRMLAESGRRGDCRRFNALAAVLFSAIFMLMGNNNSPEEFTKTSQACKYIERSYYRNDLSVEEVAAFLNISPGHLANLFKKDNLGTVRAFIIKTRLENALRLLRMRRFIIKEVAEMTGWNSQFYFTNSFRRAYGCSPSEFIELSE